MVKRVTVNIRVFAFPTDIKATVLTGMHVTLITRNEYFEIMEPSFIWNLNWALVVND